MDCQVKMVPRETWAAQGTTAFQASVEILAQTEFRELLAWRDYQAFQEPRVTEASMGVQA